jgi:hypothetical protein
MNLGKLKRAVLASAVGVLWIVCIFALSSAIFVIVGDKFGTGFGVLSGAAFALFACGAALHYVLPD